MSVVTVDDLSVELADGSRIVDAVSFTLNPGEVLGVVGESGSGKSTLALALLGHVRRGARISSGNVRIGDTALLGIGSEQLRQARRRLVSYVSQDPATALNPSLRLRTQLLETVPGGEANALARVRGILATVGLPADDDFLRRRPSQLSGGQQQRVAIAMAVAAGPSLIVLDEPTTGLDVSTQAMVLEMVGRLCRQRHMAAVYISHDLAVVAEIADRVMVMYGGQIVETGSSRRVLRTPSHPYTRALLNAVPSATERLRLVPIPGRAPLPGQHRTGCVFAHRCSFAIDTCRQSAPAAVPSPGGGTVRCIRIAEVTSRPRAAERLDLSPTREVHTHEAPVLHAHGLSARYAERSVLFDVSLSLPRAACLAIVGESGSGKTTLSRCLIGLHPQQTGELRFNDGPLAAAARDRTMLQRQRLQYVFQNPYGSLNPRLSVESSIAIPLRHFHGLRGAAARARILEALDRVGIPSRLAASYPAELSGGQRQRVAIARALVCEPMVLICDEVTSALDVSVQAAVVELLRSLQQDGLSLVFVTHNLAVVRSIADQVIVLNEGRVVEVGSTAEVLSSPQHAYTQRLLADTLEIPA